MIPSSAAHERGARGLGGRAPNPWGGVWGWPRCGPGEDGRCWSRAMSERWRSSSSMTRRDVVKGAVAVAALGAGSVLTGRDVAATPRPIGGPTPEVAIIGAGAGGVAAAYFLAGTLDVDLFEARSKIGGHCDSHVIDYRGQQDHRRSRRPVLSSRHAPHLRHAAGASRPLRSCPPRQRRHAGRRPPACASSRPPGARRSSRRRTRSQRHAGRSISSRYTQLARQAVLSDMPWKTTVDAWIRSLPVEPVVQERRRVSVDHGVDRVRSGRRAAGVGAVDSADVRVGVSGQRRSGRESHTTRRSACRATYSACWTAARRRGCTSARPCTRLRREARRLVPGDADRRPRALPLCRVERAAARRTQAAVHAAPASRTSRRY